MNSVTESFFSFSTAVFNTTSDITKGEPPGNCGGSPGKPCEWPLLWTIIAAFASTLVFCVVQAILYIVDDPGKAESKKVEI